MQLNVQDPQASLHIQEYVSGYTPWKLQGMER